MTKKIEFTNRAKEQIEKIINEDQLKKFFRISVKGGGCSGFKYNFSFDDKTDNDDIVFIPKDSNDNVKIPIRNYTFKNKFDGTEISTYLGIRPEHIYFEKINPDCFEISLKSELLEYTGHEQIVTFDYFGQQVLGKFASTLDININKDLKLNIDMSQISLFDKHTKHRI